MVLVMMVLLLLLGAVAQLFLSQCLPSAPEAVHITWLSKIATSSTAERVSGDFRALSTKAA
jgi:hypothetical protein